MQLKSRSSDLSSAWLVKRSIAFSFVLVFSSVLVACSSGSSDQGTTTSILNGSNESTLPEAPSTTIPEIEVGELPICFPNCGAIDLSGSNFRNLNLANSIWTGTDISNSDFTGSDLTGATFDSVDSFGANFSNSNLVQAVLNGQFSNTSFNGAKFSSETDFSYSYFARSDFRNSNLGIGGWAFSCDCLVPAAFSNFDGLDLTGVDFTSAELTGSSFVGSNLTDSKFPTSDDYGGAFHLDLRSSILAGVDFSNTDISGSVFVGAKTEAAIFSDSSLSYGVFDIASWEPVSKFVEKSETISIVDSATRPLPQELVQCELTCTNRNFDGLDLSNVNISSVDFTGSSFVGANLKNVVAIESNFSSTNFSQASLEHAILFAANFAGATLDGSVITECDCSKASFVDVKVFRPIGLEIMTKFIGTDFSGTSLSGMVFASSRDSTSDLRGTRFVGANLENSKFQWRALRYSDFTDANLTNADFGNSGWLYASFRNAQVSSMGIDGVNLDYADIKGVQLEQVAGREVANGIMYAMCGYRDFANSYPEAELRGSCFDPRPLVVNCASLRFRDVLPIGPCSEGYGVSMIQNALISYGYQIEPDGQYGQATADAVSQFQGEKGLMITGTVDVSTYAALGPIGVGTDLNGDGVVGPNETIGD